MYKVVFASTVNGLEQRVSKYLENGWLPTGGVRVIIRKERPRTLFVQSVYRQMEVVLSVGSMDFTASNKDEREPATADVQT